MTLQIQQTELGRLMGRGPWGDDVDSFAQEIVSLMPSLFRELPVAKVEAIATDDNPAPIQLEDFTTDGNVPFATVTRGTDTFNITLNPRTGTLESDAPNQPPASGGGVTSNAYIGTIASGSGLVYDVLLIGGTTVSATAIQLDVTTPLPVGTGVIVVKSGTVYYFQPAVWL